MDLAILFEMVLDDLGIEASRSSEDNTSVNYNFYGGKLHLYHSIYKSCANIHIKDGQRGPGDLIICWRNCLNKPHRVKYLSMNDPEFYNKLREFINNEPI